MSQNLSKILINIFSKLIGLLIFCSFFYQWYDLTGDYLEYNYVSNLEVKLGENVRPAMSVCLKQTDISPRSRSVFNPKDLKDYYTSKQYELIKKYLKTKRLFHNYQDRYGKYINLPIFYLLKHLRGTTQNHIS